VIGWGTDGGKFYWIVSNSWVLRVTVAVSLSTVGLCGLPMPPHAHSGLHVTATAQAAYSSYHSRTVTVCMHCHSGHVSLHGTAHGTAPTDLGNWHQCSVN